MRGPRRDLMRFRNAARRDHHALYLGDLDCARIRPRANWRTGEAFIERLRVIIPPTGNQFIAMLKDSSLVSVVGVWELTCRDHRRAARISSHGDADQRVGDLLAAVDGARSDPVAYRTPLQEVRAMASVAAVFFRGIMSGLLESNHNELPDLPCPSIPGCFSPLPICSPPFRLDRTFYW
ncbi:hypothetical protein HDG40_001526 [Paraburkholderia sp. JPY158]|uniref:Uncharacterized protein n=2 Tax=Paraburkholderia atlantica TaxID=2654982 RepID=A0A7W8V543_PARAM|nr:hypothetical protein [Paraburkholderia atlantica]MBB5423384.1 hypothetical protein [Paraburkholderia atlantica]